jgi:hypothetical protein
MEENFPNFDTSGYRYLNHRFSKKLSSDRFTIIEGKLTAQCE